MTIPRWARVEGSVVKARTGLVRANGKGIADGDAEFLGFGASYFPAIALERDDPTRLDQNLALLSGQSDFIRLFGDVGGGVWSARETHADWPDYWPVVDRLFQRLTRHGLRAEVCIFAGSPVFTSEAARAGFVDQWAAFCNTHRDQIFMDEIANEGTANPFLHMDLAEIIRHRHRLKAQVPHLVTTTTPAWGDQNGCALAPDYMPLHAPRAPWPDYIRQLWGIGCVNGLTTNDEGKGLMSSVQEDSDPVHQTIHALISWICGEASFTLHSGAGTYAQENPPGIPTPRKANLWEQPGFVETVHAIANLRTILPTNVPNLTRVNGHWANSPLLGIGGQLSGRAQFVTDGAKWWGGIYGRDIMALTLTTKVPMSIRNILTGATLIQIPAGGPLPFGNQDAYLLTSP